MWLFETETRIVTITGVIITGVIITGVIITGVIITEELANNNNNGNMAARGFEFCLRVLKVLSSAREDKIRIPKQPCNVLFIL